MSVGHKAVTPEEARKRHLEEFIPDEVYEVFDEILSERYGASIKIYQKEVIARALEKMQSDGTNVPKEDFFKYHWLDIEPAYEAQGWLVMFYKPDYTEAFDAYWLFTVSDRND